MSTFSKLNEFVYMFYLSSRYMGRTRFEYRDLLWEKMNSSPIEQASIAKLKEDGWQVNSGYRYAGNMGMCNFNDKEIWILPGLDPYVSDKVLCHEVVHAVYGEELSTDIARPDASLDRKRWAKKNNLLVEWTGRRIRSTPILLSDLWKNFNISPRIYDSSSLLATIKVEWQRRQFLFPSLVSDYDFTLMD